MTNGCIVGTPVFLPGERHEQTTRQKTSLGKETHFVRDNSFLVQIDLLFRRFGSFLLLMMYDSSR